MKISAIIQARMGSTRLPGKVLMNIEGRPMLWHVINRLKYSKKLKSIILAIPDTKENDILEKFAKENKVKYFKGSEEDILSRYYLAAKQFKVDIIVRITSDCPLIDPKIVDRTIEKHLETGADYTSRGLDTEVFDFEVLKRTYKEAQAASKKEFVTRYVRNNPGIFHLANIKNKKDFFYMRWTVDETKDLEFIRRIYKGLCKKKKKIFLMKDVIGFLKQHPELMKINKNVKQKKI